MKSDLNKSETFLKDELLIAITSQLHQPLSTTPFDQDRLF